MIRCCEMCRQHYPGDQLIKIMYEGEVHHFCSEDCKQEWESLLSGKAEVKRPKENPLDLYKNKVREKIQAVCIDNFSAGQCSCPEVHFCTINRYLPQIIELTKEVHGKVILPYFQALEKKICPLCEWQDEKGNCPFRESAECCLYRYLPLVVDAIEEVNKETRASTI